MASVVLAAAAIVATVQLEPEQVLELFERVAPVVVFAPASHHFPPFLLVAWGDCLHVDPWYLSCTARRERVLSLPLPVILVPPLVSILALARDHQVHPVAAAASAQSFVKML